ncbi:MAG: peptidoglycan-binding protein [Aminipila sp.]
MGLGYLKVQVHTANDALPISGASIEIATLSRVYYRLTTDINGDSKTVSLSAPSIRLTLNSQYNKPAYSVYDMTIKCAGYITKRISNVPIVDTQTTIMIENMQPLLDEEDSITDEYLDIAPLALLDTAPDRQDQLSISTYQYKTELTLHDNREENIVKLILPIAPRGVYIPEYITVHLGTPANASARNLTVKFIDYIKNVVSSEIYSTWPLASLEANTNAIVTFALNRIYTEWYRSRGFNFDITNSTSYDMSYREGGPVFENISVIVDYLFNIYASRIGLENPFFTQFCNGTTVTCNGLSQWGTVTLANQGKSPLEILRYYYTDDLLLEMAEIIEGIIESYPGYPLSLGSQGEPVKRMQDYLNRISVNYPLIRQISNPNGIFGADTAEAVRVFQRTFNMTADGVIGRATWNKITFIFMSVTRLAELDSEGLRISIGQYPPNVVLSIGSRGPDVIEVQFLLSYISIYYPSVIGEIQDGYYGPYTANAVIEFQKTFDLYPDGVVGAETWNKLYAVYYGIQENVLKPPAPSQPANNAPEYPGSPLSYGSTGANVITMQAYLNTIGTIYPAIPIITVDGVFGEETKNAVVAFQKLNFIEPDGIIGPVTWDKIVEVYLIVTGYESASLVFPGIPLAIGSQGQDVRLMQNFLSELQEPYPTLPKVIVDGVFSENTENAVLAFQKLFGLNETGIIDSETWYAIIDKRNTIL